MKKVVLLLSVVAAIALNSCGNKQAEATPVEVIETEVVVNEDEATATDEADEAAEEATEEAASEE